MNVCWYLALTYSLALLSIMGTSQWSVLSYAFLHDFVAQIIPSNSHNR